MQVISNFTGRFIEFLRNIFFLPYVLQIVSEQGKRWNDLELILFIISMVSQSDKGSTHKCINSYRLTSKRKF